MAYLQGGNSKEAFPHKKLNLGLGDQGTFLEKSLHELLRALNSFDEMTVLPRGSRPGLNIVKWLADTLTYYCRPASPVFAVFYNRKDTRLAIVLLIVGPQVLLHRGEDLERTRKCSARRDDYLSGSSGVTISPSQ